MPHLYITGVDADGRSAVLERLELTIEAGFAEVLRLAENAAVIAEGPDDVPLLESPTEPGGSVYYIYPWRPGERTGMHRTTTTDVDIVLQGSVEMELQTETVTLHAGDCAMLPGLAHAWISGPEGAIVLYNLVSGRPSGADVDRQRGRLL